jgi:hypothetical protein
MKLLRQGRPNTVRTVKDWRGGDCRSNH